MPFQEFCIELDNPTASYFPNQNVTGRVIVKTLNDESTKGIKIKLQGKVEVKWTEHPLVRNKLYDGSSNSSVPMFITDTVNYKASEDLIDFKNYIVGDGGFTVKIPKGRNVYPFNFQLPQMLPSSFSGAHGKVWYEVSATLQRSWRFDREEKLPITVNAILDLNANPALAASCEHREEKNFGFLGFKDGRLGFLIKLPTQGYIPGQNVTPVVEIYNQSSKVIKEVSLELIQNVEFFAKGKSKHASKTIASACRGGVGPGDTDTWEGNILQIPSSVPPSKLGLCRIIDVNYCLKFKAHISGMFSSNLTKSIPITIGTIQFASSFTEPSSVNVNPPCGVGGSMYPEVPAPLVHNAVNVPPGGGIRTIPSPPYPTAPQIHNEMPPGATNNQAPYYGWKL